MIAIKNTIFSNFLYAISVLLGLDELFHKFYIRKRKKIMKNELLKRDYVKKCKVKMHHYKGRFTTFYLEVSITVDEAKYVAELLTEEVNLQKDVLNIHHNGLNFGQMRNPKFKLEILYA